ncbi:MAG: undecaprenyl-diphosphate phosphatase [Lentisphaeria bacterium]|nr:undecaprenyl-diphosphate phosphatase [Lentisphaeria bacterium]
MELLWKAALQGIVQGITEFLPVSSTAHLLLTGDLLDMGHDEFVKIFNVVIQLASILAVVIYFRRSLIPAAMLRDGTVRRRTFGLWGKLIVGVLPILVIGAAVAKLGWKDAMDERPLILAAALFIGGVLLLQIENWCRHEKPVSELDDVSFRTAFLIGLIQCLAIVPGTSRSASTIIGALALGLARPVAVEFSFLLAVPTMTAASAYTLLKHHSGLSSNEWLALGIGSVVTFLVSLVAVSWLMKFIQTHTFQLFGWYRMALAVAVAAYVLMH